MVLLATLKAKYANRVQHTSFAEPAGRLCGRKEQHQAGSPVESHPGEMLYLYSRALFGYQFSKS